MSAFGGKADIVRPPRGGLSVSCNWQIGAQGTSRKCCLPKIDVRAAHNGPHGFYAISIDRLIQPLVIQATAHRKKYLAELASMWGYFVLLKVGHSAPYLDQRQMIGSAALLQYVVAQETGILRAVDA